MVILVIIYNVISFKSLKKRSKFIVLTVGPWADVKNGFTGKNIIVLKVRGGNGELKFSEEILLRCLSAEI